MSGKEKNREMGIQPLDSILSGEGIANSDLVEASTEQLTHKQVQKSRRGRWVTPNIQKKVLNALNSVMKPRGSTYALRDLFNYGDDSDSSN